MTTAEIITIGTELLLGETADTNARFLARILLGLTIPAKVIFNDPDIGDIHVITWNWGDGTT